MIVADTSALIAIIFEEPDAAIYKHVYSTTENLLIAAPTAFEFEMVALGRKGVAGLGLARMMVSAHPMTIIAWDGDHLKIAVDAFDRFGKKRHKAGLNFGDCMSYALAKSLKLPLLYKGDDFSLTDIRSALG